MQTPPLPARDVVLIGPGHTNMHIVRMWRMRPIADVQLTLVSPFSRATYSGMLPGVLAALYPPEQMEIDLYRFCTSCGVRLIVAECTGLDPQRRRVQLAGRPPVRYDVLSIGIGSIPAGDLGRGRPGVLAIKPMVTFRQRLLDALQGLPSPYRIAVVGAGAGGVEVAFSIDALLNQRQAAHRIALVDSGPEILSGYTTGTVRHVRGELERRGIALFTGSRVEEFAGSALGLREGGRVEADLVIWATGAAPPPVLERLGLPRAEDGFLAVRPTLQTIADYPIFVVGDTASIAGQPLPRAGVYAVREGPVLWDNIQRILSNRPLLPYRPQRGFLSLLGTGEGRAVGQYLGLSFQGRWAWRWKDQIDRKFMRMYQDYRPMTPAMQARRLASSAPAPTMRCRGCGGKVGANVLRAALERLEIPPSKFTRQGLDRPDDAAVLDPQAGALDVLSVDFFSAFLDDPYLVGRVAALNALSDLWAMGSEPAGAMAMVTLPQGPPNQQAELLYQLLAGGLAELTAAGCTLLGGHTLEGSDLTIGYTVLGQLSGRAPWTKGNLRPGDRLVLAKPLGTGVLLAAHGESRCEARWMDELLSNMLQSNAAAARVAQAFGVQAVTDVTGFGLAGHLLEMLDASGVHARLALAALPLLPGFRELATQGIRSTLDPANRGSEEHIEVQGSREHAGYHALFDPQTSGGLLIGIGGDRAEELQAALRAAGYSHATIVGEVVPPQGSSLGVIAASAAG
jgi:selenide,water dikinase